MSTKVLVENQKLEQYNRWLKKLKVSIWISTILWLVPYLVLRGIASLYMLITNTDIAQDNLLFPTDPISQPAGYLSYMVMLVIALITAYFVIKSLRYRDESGNSRIWLTVVQVVLGVAFLFLGVFIGFMVLMFQNVIASYLFPYSFQ